MTTNFANMYISHILEWVLFIIYCLQFYVHLGPESPLDER
jgi:hypothetical protein